MFWEETFSFTPQDAELSLSSALGKISNSLSPSTSVHTATLRCFASRALGASHQISVALADFPRACWQTMRWRCCKLSGFAAAGKGNPHDFTI